MLDVLLRSGLPVVSGCRSGICHACLLRVESGNVPAVAQPGLAPAQIATNHALACRFPVDGSLDVSRPAFAGRRYRAELLESRECVPDVLRVRMKVPAGFRYEPGQYVTLWRDETTCRAYSLASLPGEGFLEFHVRVLDDGRLSRWLAGLRPGANVELRGPIGSCVYSDHFKDTPMLLVASGVGLAPLWGVLRQALKSEHRGPIHLLHVVNALPRAYLHSELSVLQAVHSNLSYEAVPASRLPTVALAKSASFSGWKIFLCGAPELVSSMRKQLFLAGAASRDILADPFVSQAGGAWDPDS